MLFTSRSGAQNWSNVPSQWSGQSPAVPHVSKSHSMSLIDWEQVPWMVHELLGPANAIGLS